MYSIYTKHKAVISRKVSQLTPIYTVHFSKKILTTLWTYRLGPHMPIDT